jgi:hypothetical protein
LNGNRRKNLDAGLRRHDELSLRRRPKRDIKVSAGFKLALSCCWRSAMLSRYLDTHCSQLFRPSSLRSELLLRLTPYSVFANKYYC